MKLRLIPLAIVALLAFSSCKDNLNGPSATPSTSDTIAFWNFNGNLTDATGNGHNGTLTGTSTYGPDRFGNANSALVLDGKTFVSVADKSDIDFTGDNSFTICAWTKTTDSNAMGIVAKGPADGSEPGYQLDLNTIELGLWSSVTTASQNPGWGDAFPTDVSDGRWHMLTMVVTAHTGIALYIDSMLEVTDNDAGLEPELNNTALLLFGTDPTKTKFFQGSLDEVTILDRAIDPVEVMARFHQGGWYEHPDTVVVTTPKDTTGWTQGSFGTSASIEGMCFAWIDTAYACGTNGTILRSIDGGTTWAAQNSGTTQNLYRIRFIDQNNGIAGGNNGTVLKTTNAGTTWTQLTLPSLPVVNIRDIYWWGGNSINTNGMMVVVGGTNTGGTEGVILVSTDGGVSWVTAMTTTSGALYGIDQTTATVVGNAGQIYKYQGGTTWSSESVSGAGDDLTQICFSGQNIGITVSAYGTIYQTNNGGTSWSGPQQSPVSSALRAVSMVSQTESWIAGANGVILHSTNSGASWSQQSIGGFTGSWNDFEWASDIPYPVHRIAFIGDNGTLYWYNH
jgi:photosystem II stability/assembly factor-like uncharacterized protein